MKIRLLPLTIEIYQKNFVLKRERWNLSILKSCLLLFFLMTFFLAHNIQAREVTSPQEDISLIEALEKLSRKYEVLFSYSETSIADMEVKFYPEKYTDLNHELDQLLDGTELKFKQLDDKYIILYELTKDANSSLNVIVPNLEAELNKPINVSPDIENKGVNGVLEHSFKHQFDQFTFSVSGTVRDQEGEPLIGVNIHVKGTEKGTATDFDGNFNLEDIDENVVLVVSYIGYETQEIVVAGRTNLIVTLVSDSQLLDEVVVVGYGTVKRKENIGSVSSVGGGKLVSSAASDVTGALSGRLAGVTVRQSSGEPGRSSSTITVRGRTTLGNNSPLVVIDNVPGRSLSEIDPNDIESISVLKDASAAIYGASAANGVILVTTKRGTEGKMRVGIDSYVGLVTPTVVPEMANAQEYATMVSELQMYEGKERKYTDQDISLYGTNDDPWGHSNTNWQDVLIADWTTSSRHNLNVQGSESKLAYYFSLGYKNDEAIYKQEKSANYNQFNGRSKLDFSITDWMNLSYDFAGFQNNRTYPGRSSSRIWSEANRMPPTSPAFWPSGQPGPDIERGDNPAVTSTFETGKELQKNYIVQNSLRLNISPLKDLSVELGYSYDIDNQHSSLFIKPWTLYFANWETAQDTNGDGFFDDVDLTPIKRSEYGSPQLDEAYNRSSTQLANLNFHYLKNFGKHSINVFAGFEQLISESNVFSAFRKDYISKEIVTLDAGGENQKTNSGSAYYYARRSFIGRINYNFDEKYLATFTFRRDGSIKYSPEGRWGNFPSIMLGWRTSEENFWKENIFFVNYFKLRASYGKLGMDPGSPYQYLNKYAVGKGLAMGTSKSVESRVFLESFANKLITWEKEDAYNIGFESQFLNNTFTLEADYFYKKRYDILSQRNASLPEFSGLKLPQENLAEVDNRGVEFIVGYNMMVRNDFRMTVSGNLGYNRNKVVFMDEAEGTVPWQKREGYSYGAQLVYDVTGVFADESEVESKPHWPGAKPGDLIFRDVDGDGEITVDDRIILDKVNEPRTFYGLGIDLQYRNWNLYMLFQGQGKLYQNIVSELSLIGESGNYYKFMYDNRWTLGEVPGVDANINTDVPRPFEREDQYWGLGRAPGSSNNYWWRNTGEYLRFKNVSLSYSFPKGFGSKVGISNINLFLRGNNLLFLYRSQKVRDPESNDIAGYPLSKTIALGLNVSF